MEISTKMNTDWMEASRQKLLRMCPSPLLKPHGSSIKWYPPPTGKLKLNVDAFVFTGELFFKMGLVIRDDHGQFCERKDHVYSRDKRRFSKQKLEVYARVLTG